MIRRNHAFTVLCLNRDQIWNQSMDVPKILSAYPEAETIIGQSISFIKTDFYLKTDYFLSNF